MNIFLEKFDSLYALFLEQSLYFDVVCCLLCVVCAVGQCYCLAEPVPPTAMIVKYVGKTSIEVTWEAPQGVDFDSYNASIRPGSYREVQLDRQVAYWKFDRLFPGSTYSVSIHTISRGRRSFPLAINITTCRMEFCLFRTGINSCLDD